MSTRDIVVTERNVDTDPWCVIIEHRDGTVQVLGPYLDEEPARKRADNIAADMVGDEWIQTAGRHDEYTLTFEIGGDDVWIYLQRMSR
jgi:hypothetical protein